MLQSQKLRDTRTSIKGSLQLIRQQGRCNTNDNTNDNTNEVLKDIKPGANDIMIAAKDAGTLEIWKHTSTRKINMKVNNEMIKTM